MIHVIYGLTIFVHVIACIGLIAVILLQAGKGGGLNEAFGGATQNLFGSKSNEVLVRATATFAIVFLCTSMLLGILTSKRGRSLLTQDDILKQLKEMQKNEQQLPKATEDKVKAVTQTPQKLVKQTQEETVPTTTSKDVAEK